MSHRLHDPSDYTGRRVLVVGGGDSAVESAIALAESGAAVTLAHRGATLARPKPENREALERLAASGAIEVQLATELRSIGSGDCLARLRLRPRSHDPERLRVLAYRSRRAARVPAPLGASDPGRVDGRPPPGPRRLRRRLLRAVQLEVGRVPRGLAPRHGRVPVRRRALARRRASPARSARSCASRRVRPPSTTRWPTRPSWSSSASAASVAARRRTSRVQTLTLMAIQVVPLFLLPEIVLPWLDAQRPSCPARCVADALFPRVDYGHGREFWRAYGLDPGLAAVRLQRVHGRSRCGAWLVLSSRADVRADPGPGLRLGQGRVLRLDLLVRRPGRDAGRHAPAQDAARPALEPAEPGRPGDPGHRARRSLVLRIVSWLAPDAQRPARVRFARALGLRVVLQVDRRRPARRRPGLWRVLLVLRARVVPLLLPARRA